MSTEVESYLKTSEGFTRINDYDGTVAYRSALLDELYQLRQEIQNGDLGDLLRAGASLDDVMGNF